MRVSAARLVTASLVAAGGIFAGALLGRYAEADDAPGGVVIAALLIIGSVALALWIALRPARKPS
jgi:hypothetical protein